MSLPSINFLHFTVIKILPGQNFKGKGHYSKIKSQIKVTPCHCKPTTPNQCPYHVSSSYTLRFLRYSSDKILRVKGTMTRSKIKVTPCRCTSTTPNQCPYQVSPSSMLWFPRCIPKFLCGHCSLAC